MQYGQRIIQRGLKGTDVEELQIRLAGFSGASPDGAFGLGTELQVIQFQKDVMEMDEPTGIVDRETMEAIDTFAETYPIDFDALKCPCGVCDGFGQGRFKGKYRGSIKTERAYLYEYPGIHRMLLWAVRAAFFYNPDYTFTITSGYRCGVRNEQAKRSSTNHHGKAIDIDVLGEADEDKRDDMKRCKKIRNVIIETANAQLGWGARNRKSLEPDNMAPTWVHYDVRSYVSKYLEDRFFCKTLEQLDNTQSIEI